MNFPLVIAVMFGPPLLALACFVWLNGWLGALVLVGWVFMLLYAISGLPP